MWNSLRGGVSLLHFELELGKTDWLPHEESYSSMWGGLQISKTKKKLYFRYGSSLEKATANDRIYFFCQILPQSQNRQPFFSGMWTEIWRLRPERIGYSTRDIFKWQGNLAAVTVTFCGLVPGLCAEVVVLKSSHDTHLCHSFQLCDRPHYIIKWMMSLLHTRLELGILKEYRPWFLWLNLYC